MRPGDRFFYYFGCIGDTGHYLWMSPWAHAPHIIMHKDNPWGTSIDGKLCPPGAQVQGQALLHHLNGWTALAFWDRSVDSRPGSCSVFLATYTVSFDEMLELARARFAPVLSRFKFTIVSAEKPAP